MLKPDAPKLAILDWMMPGMDGVEVCRKIRAAKFVGPAYLIILTIRDKTGDIVKGLKAGANDYIVKPYNVEELQVRVGVGCRVMEMQATMARQINELEVAMAHIKALRKLLPICMYCKKSVTTRNTGGRLRATFPNIAKPSSAIESALTVTKNTSSRGWIE
ncbi:MAG: response regulator [Kiritimatiellae bacterium]|nr:response regulator [Kiritimatiellia bacterium]